MSASSKKHKALLFVACGFGAIILLWILLYLIGFRVYRVPTASMEPTITADGYSFAKLEKNYSAKVKRNEVVVSRFQSERNLSSRHSFKMKGQTYTMRVVGLPGDKIRVSKEGVFVNDQEIVTPNGPTSSAAPVHKLDTTIPESSYFMIGDNAPVSFDSRYFGFVQAEEIMGRILFVE